MAGYKFLQEEAYAHIKEQIVTGALQKDQIYSETKLAAMIGILLVMLVMISSSFADDGVTAQYFVDAFSSVCGDIDFTVAQ